MYSCRYVDTVMIFCSTVHKSMKRCIAVDLYYSDDRLKYCPYINDTKRCIAVDLFYMDDDSSTFHISMI